MNEELREEILARGFDSKDAFLRHTWNGIVDTLAGTAGGTAAVYVGQPLDTVKVKMQTFPGQYTNGFKCFRDTFVKEGIRRGLYAGTVPALAANIGENAVLFCAYGFCLNGVNALFGLRDAKERRPIHNAIAGSAAAVFSTFALCPTELVKCRLQAMRETHEEMARLGKPYTGLRIGPGHMVKTIIFEQGIQGLFKGFWPTFAREVPGYFFFFGAYEVVKRLLVKKGTDPADASQLVTAFAGGCGGVALWVAIFPFDVVKSRVQIKGHGSLFPMLLQILRNEGFRALYKGLGPTVTRTFFATGALFVAVESTKKLLHSLGDPYPLWFD